jgi:hypothetical protein
MWQLAVVAAMAAVAVAVIVVVARWSLRGTREPAGQLMREPAGQMPARNRAASARPASRTPAAVSQIQRQGDNVAKSRARFGLGERVGWLKKTDRDAEMWPAEAFGGVSDEQFWDDMSNDKPLSARARIATPDGDAHARAAQPARKPAPLPPIAGSPGQAARTSQAARIAPAAHVTPAAQASTAAFPAITAHAAAAAQAGPTAAPAPTAPTANTAAFPIAGSPGQAARAPQALTPAQGYPMGTGPVPAAGSGGNGPATGPMPASSGQLRSRRRHSAEEDPLTSDAYSLRSSGDGRSYRSARHSAPAADTGGYETQPGRGGDRAQYGTAPDPYGTGTGAYPAGSGYATGGYPASGYPASGYPASTGYGSGSGGYPTVDSGSGGYPAADRYASGGSNGTGGSGHRRDSYPGNDGYAADGYPSGPGYRAADSGYGAALPYSGQVPAGPPTPPYGERYTTPARAYSAVPADYPGQAPSGRGNAEYGSRDYSSRDYAALDYGRGQDRDGRSPYQPGRSAPGGGNRH